MIKKIALIALLAFFWSGCSNSTSYGDGTDEDISRFLKSEKDTLDGMRRIYAAGASIMLGTNDVSAKSNERPAMRVEFSYDFSIARAEVTCGE